MQRPSYRLPLPPTPILGMASKDLLFLCHAVPGCVEVEFEILRWFRRVSYSTSIRKDCRLCKEDRPDPTELVYYASCRV
jgi:hypothetical protein